MEGSSMVKPRKKVAIVLAAFLIGGPVLAQAPTALSIIVNGVPLEGKALMYKGRVYVPLEDVAHSTGGSYSYDPKTGIVEAMIASQAERQRMPEPQSSLPPALPGRSHEAAVRPVLSVSQAKKYVSPSNARVIATVSNNGSVPAQNVEAVCTFKDGELHEIGASFQMLGSLSPGESRTVEFRLYDSGSGSTVASPVGSVGAPPDDKILLYGNWTRVSYNIQLNYAGADTTRLH
jgi:hypothetical protein